MNSVWCRAMADNVMRVGIIAPMQLELEPIIRGLKLIEVLPNEWRGAHDGVEVVATRSDIGMDAARHATRALLRFEIDHVMVVGIAGAVRTRLPIGVLIAPAAVVDRATGRTFTPSVFAGATPTGVISCGDDLITDSQVLQQLGGEGVIALDMETAAVAQICVEHHCDWSVWRSISDHAGGGLIDTELFAMTKPDGTADPAAVKRALQDPVRLARLTQLAHDANLAAKNAAAAAIQAIVQLDDRNEEPIQ